MAKISLRLPKSYNYEKAPGPKPLWPEWETPENLTLLAGWCRNGLSMSDIAANMGIDHSTLCSYRKKSSKIDGALRISREVADLAVENALFKNAVQNENITAQKYWLANRRPEQWREKQEIHHSGTMERPLKGLTVSEIRKLLNEEDDNAD